MANLFLLLIIFSWMKTEGGIEKYTKNLKNKENPIILAIKSITTESIDKNYQNICHFINSRIQSIIEINKAQRCSVLAHVDLSNINIAERSISWLPEHIQKKKDKINWCKENNLDMSLCRQYSLSKYPKKTSDYCNSNDTVCHNTIDQIRNIFLPDWEVIRSNTVTSADKFILKGRDMRNTDFSGSFLVGIDLINVRIDGSDFSGAYLERTGFLKNESLRNVILDSQDLTSVDFSDGRFRGADLRGAEVENASFFEAKLPYAIITDKNLSEKNFYDADLSNSLLWRNNFSGSNMIESDISDAFLIENTFISTNISGSYAKNANFSNSDLSDAKFIYSNLNGAIFFSTLLKNATFTLAGLRRANFDSAYLDGAKLSRAIASDASFQNARLIGANLASAFLERSNLSDADLTDANLRGAILREAKMDRVILDGADLTGAVGLTQIQLKDTVGDDQTILPLDAETGAQLTTFSCFQSVRSRIRRSCRHGERPITTGRVAP